MSPNWTARELTPSWFTLIGTPAGNTAWHEAATYSKVHQIAYSTHSLDPPTFCLDGLATVFELGVITTSLDGLRAAGSVESANWHPKSGWVETAT